jgi:hypothetical protein
VQPLPRVTVINIADALEAVALRAALEWWNIEVTLRHVGAADQLVALLDGTVALSPLVVLMCHGDERGILLPELAPELEQTQPFTGAVGPVELRQFLRVPGCAVVNTGCITGTGELAAAFIDGGASVYIGPADYPDAPGSLFFCLAFAYDHLVRGYSLAEAHRRAAAHDAETAQFQYFARSSA